MKNTLIKIVALVAFLFSLVVRPASAATPTTAETVATLQALASKEKDPSFSTALADLGKAAQGQSLTPERTSEVKAKLTEMATGLRTASTSAGNAADRAGFARDAAAVEAGLAFLSGGVVPVTEVKVVLPPSKFIPSTTPSTGDSFRDGIKRFLEKESRPEWKTIVTKADAYVNGGSLGDNDLIDLVDKLDTMAKGLRSSSSLTNVRVDKVGYLLDAKSVLEELLRRVEAKFAGTVPPAPSITVVPVTTAPSAPAPVAPATKPVSTGKKLSRPTPPAPAPPAPKPTGTGHEGEVAKAPPAPATK